MLMLLPLLLLLSAAGTKASAVIYQNHNNGIGISQERLMSRGPRMPDSFELADDNLTLDFNELTISSFFNKSVFFGPFSAFLQLVKKSSCRSSMTLGTCLLCTYAMGLFSPRLSCARSLDQDMTLHKKMKPHEVVYRVMKFWVKTGPLIVHYQFSRFWMTQIRRYDETRKEIVYERLHERYSPQALEILLDMKGLFIKIGQVLSSRPDFIPPIYVECFSTLQDEAPGWPGLQSRAIIEHSLKTVHGLTFEEVFASFEDKPIGSASIGQVHSATLSQEFLKIARKGGYAGGETIAIKVMHLDAKDRFRNDLKIFKWLCRVTLPGWGSMLREFEKQIMTEFDYALEASNLSVIRKNMMNSPFKNRVVVPQPIEEFTTSNVLLMEMLDGEKLLDSMQERLSSILNGDEDLVKTILKEKKRKLTEGSPKRSESIRDEIETIRHKITDYSFLIQARMCVQLVNFLIKQQKNINLLVDVHGYQIFANGIFNGDPHPGNILQLSNGKLGLIDYGQCKSLNEVERTQLSRIVCELASSTVNDFLVADTMRELGFRFKYDKANISRQMADLFFGSDRERSELGFANPQMYLQHLQSQDPMENVPDAAVFVGRTSFLFRGMGSFLGQHIHTSKRWYPYASMNL